MASGHYEEAHGHQERGRTHGCTDQCCKREESSCQPGAVHTWHLTDVVTPRSMSALGVKADDGAAPLDFRFYPYFARLT